MKTITDVVKLLGKTKHNGIAELSQAVYEKCKEFGIEKTKAKREITILIVDKTVRSILSCIKTGKGKWEQWSYRHGKNYIKLYDNAVVDILSANKTTLEAFEYVDAPEIKVRVNPKKEGVDAEPFYHVCKTLSEAQEYYEKEEFTTGIFVAVGNIIIPLDDIEKRNI